MQQTRPTLTTRSVPAAPAPRWEGLFVEPVYTDGRPYQEATVELDHGADDAPPAMSA